MKKRLLFAVACAALVPTLVCAATELQPLFRMLTSSNLGAALTAYIQARPISDQLLAVRNHAGDTLLHTLLYEMKKPSMHTEGNEFKAFLLVSNMVNAPARLPKDKESNTKELVNLKNHRGQTPLMLAAGADFKTASGKRIPGILLNYGALVFIKDRQGKTASDYAKNKALKNELREARKQQQIEELEQGWEPVGSQG